MKGAIYYLSLMIMTNLVYYHHIINTCVSIYTYAFDIAFKEAYHLKLVYIKFTLSWIRSLYGNAKKAFCTTSIPLYPCQGADLCVIHRGFSHQFIYFFSFFL